MNNSTKVKSNTKFEAYFKAGIFRQLYKNGIINDLQLSVLLNKVAGHEKK